MHRIFLTNLVLLIFMSLHAQNSLQRADSLKQHGLLVPALEQYAMAYAQNTSAKTAYEIASTCALLWTRQMRDTAFHFLRPALRVDSTLEILYDPEFLSLIDDPRWTDIETQQIRKYEVKNGTIQNALFARELFRMIIKDQGLMYAGNIARRKFIQNGGYFDSPSIFPLLAMEEQNLKENETRLIELLDIHGWPTASAVTEYAAAGASLVINHTDYETRSKYFPMLEKAFLAGEAQPLRYAKMKDRILVEEGKEQLYGTQIKFEGLRKEPFPIQDPHSVDLRRAKIGLGPLGIYLKERFNIEWHVEQQE